VSKCRHLRVVDFYYEGVAFDRGGSSHVHLNSLPKGEQEDMRKTPTTNCSLARILRKKLHRLGVREGFTAVYSTERVDKTKVVSTDGADNKASIVGTISYMPAAFGIACASVVIRDLTSNG